MYLKRRPSLLKKNMNEGYILVCCKNGNSISAAVCMVFILEHLKISTKDAYSLLKEYRTSIRLNKYISQQVKDYYDNVINVSIEEKIEEKINIENNMEDKIESKIEETMVNETLKSEENDKENKNLIENTDIIIETSKVEDNEYIRKVDTTNTYYSCRSCRTVLFSDNDIMPHELGVGQDAFKWNKRDTSTKDNCTSFFLEGPMEWMSSTQENQGKLSCQKCNNKVGYYQWFGLQCSCGAWCVPGFQISKYKIDVNVV